MRDQPVLEVVDEDKEALLSESEKDFEQRAGRKHGWSTITGLIVTACFALVGGVFLERHVLLDKNSVCTAHVSQHSEYEILANQ